MNAQNIINSIKKIEGAVISTEPSDHTYESYIESDLTINKAEVVKLGLQLKAPYRLTWSCYEGGDRPCGTCGTCIDRAKAFEANGVQDPALEV